MDDIIDERDAHIASLQKRNEQLQKSLDNKSHKIDSLEERLRALLAKQYGKSSERFNPNQLSYLNEAEVIAASVPYDAEDDVSEVKAHKRTRSNKRKPIPDHLPLIDVSHELDEHEHECDSCGQTMERIGEDVDERLSIVPRQYYVARHVRGRYACSCKECAKNAPVPAHLLWAITTEEIARRYAAFPVP